MMPLAIGSVFYKEFYTVFYIKNGTITEERFIKYWEERDHPKNWKCIPVFERS